MKLESLLQYMDSFLDVGEHPDYPNALNGLQVAGPEDVGHIAVAVDASEAAIGAAAETDADLLVVHHGLFWGGLEPLTGRHFRKIRTLVDAGIGLYASHLPLDSHAQVGNCAVLARELGLEAQGRFGEYQGRQIGWWGTTPEPTTSSDLSAALGELLGAPVHLIEGKAGPIERVGVVTGGGASFIPAAAAAGLDALVTGEGSHHSHFDAVELGITVLFGGHYATETFGVRALAAHLEERFDLAYTYIDQPTGL